MPNKLLSQLGLCRKAGRLECGFDAVAEAIRRGRAALVLTAGDISPKSIKEIGFIAAKYNTEVIAAGATVEEIWVKTGKRAGILAVTDENLAKAIRLQAARANEEE